MDARDFIYELMLQTNDIESLLGILENLIIELDQKTSNSRERNKNLKIIGKFYVIWKGLESANKTLDKGLNSLWHKVLELEEKVKA